MTLTLPATPRTRFALPAGLEATAPPESRGLDRDQVRLLVARPEGIEHAVFRDIAHEFDAGDLVVVNTSATLPAALRVWRATNPSTLIHVAGELDDGTWIVEVRRDDNSGPVGDVVLGETIKLAGGVELTVVKSYPDDGAASSRLWRARPDRQLNRVEHLTDHGQPIRYGYVRGSWPLAQLQNVYADEPGSAEMASAGRPFTDRVLTSLVVRGVRVAPLTLHTGLSSPEKHEPPAPERYAVPLQTARLINETRADGGRIVAVGTTVVRALETVAAPDGRVHSGRGWTDVVIGPSRPVRVVDAMVSGLHEPEASHLLMLEAVAGARRVQAAYEQALAGGYLWHEFGDSMLLFAD